MRTRSLAQNNYIMTADYDSLPPHEQLIRACMEGDCERIQAAIDAGAHIRYHYDEPMRNAAAYGHIEAMRLLLRRGVNVKVMHMGAYTILKEAIESNQRDAVVLLIAAGARLSGGCEAIRIAAECGYRDMVQLLVDLGVSVKCHKNAPIREAAGQCDARAVELLLGFGAYLKNPEDYCSAVRAVVERHILKKRYARHAREEYEGIGL